MILFCSTRLEVSNYKFIFFWKMKKVAFLHVYVELGTCFNGGICNVSFSVFPNLNDPVILYVFLPLWNSITYWQTYSKVHQNMFRI